MSSSGRLQGVERNRLIDTAPALQPVPRLRRTQKSMRQSSGDSERCSASSDDCRPVDPVHVVDLAFVRRRPIQIQNDGLAAVFVVGDHELPVRQVPMNRGKQGEHLVAGIERVHGFGNGRLGLGRGPGVLAGVRPITNSRSGNRPLDEENSAATCALSWIASNTSAAGATTRSPTS